MAFASIFVPNFMVQAVMRAEPELRGRALALVEGTPPLCNVVAINEGAARMGVEIGMTKTNAEQFAGLEMRTRSAALEQSAHAALRDAGWSVSPRMEDAGEDEIVVDLAGLGSLWGGEAEMGAELEWRALACGLQVHVGMAANIDAASIAARGYGGMTVIARGEEAARLKDLPVRVLGPTQETAETLRRWGVHTCGVLAALPVLELSERLGQEGVRLHALARGASVRSLVVAQAADFFAEEMELDEAVEEFDPLSFLLGRLLDQLCARLAARALAAVLIRARFELQPAFEHACDRHKEVVRGNNPPGEYETELRLPVPVRDAKMLLKLLRLRLQAHPPGAPIQKIALAAEGARPRAMQGGLFLPSFPDPEKLELTMARIANVVGEGNVGSPEVVDTHRPGAFRMQKFSTGIGSVDRRSDKKWSEVSAACGACLRGPAEIPRGRHPRTPTRRAEDPRPHNFARFPRDAGTRYGNHAAPLRFQEPGGLHRSPDTEPPSDHSEWSGGEERGAREAGGKAAVSFRAFRPDIPARIEWHGGRPMAVSFQGARGEVRAASGPWHASGDWWREDAWQEEEWDLELYFRSAHAAEAVSGKEASVRGQRGVYRVYYDAKREEWFVRGIFD